MISKVPTVSKLLQLLSIGNSTIDNRIELRKRQGEFDPTTMPPAPEGAEFPEDVIEEILLRLPIKSLIRFKRVSKQWFRLITSPRFGFRHFSIAQAQTFDNPRRASFFVLRITDPDTTRGKDFITPITVFVRHEALRVEINPNIDFPHIESDKRDQRYLHVLFPAGFGFYGLFEIMEGTALLWNPTTRQTKVLPPSPYYHSLNGAYVYHFGKMDYKDGNFSYKLGRIISKSHYPSREATYKVTRLSLELFSSITKSWKLIPDFCTGEFMGYVDWFLHTANLNGMAHWVIRSARDDIYITTFDYETEVFSKIKAPLAPEVGHYDNSRCIVTVYDDKFLCLVLFWNTNFLDIWVMREYGVEHSWTKEFTVKDIPVDMEVLGFSSKVQGIFLRPRKALPTKLFLYDCNSSTIKSYRLNTAYRRYGLYMQVVERVKSLISIE